MTIISIPMTLSREIYLTFKKVVSALNEVYTKSEIDERLKEIEDRLDAGGL